MFYSNENDIIKHTTSPVYTGSTVIGIRYKGGVVIATDTRLNYGGLAKYMNINNRIQRVNDNTIIGVSGEYSDFQEITRVLKEETQKDNLNSKSYLGPSELTNYLSSICYHRRNKQDPYWTSNLVGGVDWNGESVLYSIDQFGTKIQANYLVTGMGIHFCQSIIEPHLVNGRELTRQEALAVVEECFKVLFYRDCRAGNNIIYGYMERDLNGNIIYDEIEKSFKGNWHFDGYMKASNEKTYLY